MYDDKGLESTGVSETEVVERMSPGERLLLYSMYQSYAASEVSRNDVSVVLTDKYTMSSDGKRTLQELRSLDDTKFDYVVSKFRKKPRLAHACGRDNLIGVINDSKCSKNEIDNRLSMYYDAYVSLIVKLDHQAFPSTGYYNPQYGMLKYLPDGFSDMGSSSKVVRRSNDRDKLRVDKESYYLQQKPVMLDLLKHVAKLREQYPNYDSKKYMAENIGIHLYNSIKYDYEGKLKPSPTMSITVSDVLNQGKGVCRHIALSTTTLLQLMGIESRYQKVRVNKEEAAHATCLFRSRGYWYLLDPTWIYSDSVKGRYRVVLKELPTNKPDFNENTVWNFEIGSDMKWFLKPHNDIYWRIIHE